MLSRVADSLYWMSRYLERAEHTARLLDVRRDVADAEPLARELVLPAHRALQVLDEERRHRRLPRLVGRGVREVERLARRRDGSGEALSLAVGRVLDPVGPRLFAGLPARIELELREAAATATGSLWLRYKLPTARSST